MFSNQNQPGIGSAKNSGGAGSASLDVGVTPVVNGTAGRVFYEKLDNTLGQVPGFYYGETTTTLSYEDSIRSLSLLIGEKEVVPSVSVPFAGFQGADGALIGWADLTSIGGSEQVFVGYQGVSGF